MTEPEDTTTALPQTCVRCDTLALLRIVGHCGNCAADMGLRHPEDYARWRAEVKKEFGVK